MTPTTKLKKNLDGDTPKQVFTKNHKDLVIEGDKWMKECATSCTIAGSLIITIMFAAAFTVPAALFTSSTSVLVFLGMLTSRYSERDFLKSLPKKLMFGLFTLFCSITAMMITFCAALIIMLEGEISVMIPIIAFAGFTVSVFVALQFPLFIDILSSTYGSIFDRKMKPWLCE
ncbi:hypothetical protein HS088_TW09G00659 [Tripterygium wilfordii]|uniref:PGG domain-containing protein n=1 Tax=Tripterygium wilfordii TaxID=458696 RepID=A0A7J7D8J3_TRIWF|nr:hypothetical protein HS088_TW09G00659 [Tripterygium wilfordii]